MSGVYIGGIEMPKTYPLIVTIYPDGQVLSGTVGAKDIHGKAVPVPPHGKVIDADLLCKVLQKNSEDEWNNKTAPFSWAYAYDCVKDTVENMPTIIPAEEGE
jgi:hypothetical protein